MPLTRLELENFTAFAHLDMELSPGVNVLVGANGTGKTHVLKVLYWACEGTRADTALVDSLVSVFAPHKGAARGLVHQQQTGVAARTRAERADGGALDMQVGRTLMVGSDPRDWQSRPIRSTYLPAKDILANAPGFLSLYNAREVSFEQVYADILYRAYLPPLREAANGWRGALITRIRDRIGGATVAEGETFFLESKGGRLEFMLVAEGFRKLALLELLIANGTLSEGSVLFWDEPEANLNPGMMGTVVAILLELQQAGVQVFLATHDYVTLKQFDLQSKPEHQVRYHALYRQGEAGEIACNSTDEYLGIQPNAIADTFADLYDADVRRALGVGQE